jgi:hypothetical protein
VGLVAIYSSNFQDMGTHDTIGTTLLPFVLLRGEGFALDRFQGFLSPHYALPPYLVRSHGHLMSRYPVAPALVILPLAMPQMAVLDWLHPGWDRRMRVAVVECKWIAKRSLTMMMALSAIILHRLLLALGLRRSAMPAVLAAMLGSDLWTLGSQALWQHGPAAMALIVALALLHRAPVARWRLLLAGVATACLFGCRLIDGLFAAVILAWVARTQPRGLAWFLPAPAIGAAALLAYNFWYFGALTGGQAELEALHPQLHGVSGMWGNFAEGALGTLFSPSRGLLIFCPWVAVALAVLCVPAVARQVAAYRLFGWLLAAVISYFILLSKYSVWWGGHCFGPRYWMDVIPLFAILFAFGFEWALENARALAAVSVLAVTWSIGVHAIGAYCYPSTWNLLPANVDLHHERLWDWRDTELSRCLSEKMWIGLRKSP